MRELLGANTDTLERVAESLSTGARRMHELRTLTQRAVAELEAGWSGRDLAQLTQQWERQASPQLASASLALDECAAHLRAQSAAQREASAAPHDYAAAPHDASAAPHDYAAAPHDASAAQHDYAAAPHDASAAQHDASAAQQMPAMAPSPPPTHGSPTDNATWWKALSPRQQQQVVRDHPDWVGSRDGIAFTARDEANRAMLEVDRASLRATRLRLQADLADSWFGGLFSNSDTELEQVRDKLASLDTVERTLNATNDPGERQLLLLDLSSVRAQAAIARGNVDTADHVAIFVPGLSANVTDSMAHYDRAMGQLQRRAELESLRAEAHQSVATVTWIGYQTPQLSSELLGDNSVTDDLAARRGATSLVPFLQGIGAARRSDAHLTLLGHSYGSTTAGLALRHSTGVDDVVLFGSPGLGTSQVKDLLVPAGHVYYIEARRDAVADLGHFGLDPSHLAGITHASARASTVVDPTTGEIRHFKEVTGHNSYLLDDSTSQYNMSVVMAGAADRQVHDQGDGVGDVLSWRIPGTYR